MRDPTSGRGWTPYFSTSTAFPETMPITFPIVQREDEVQFGAYRTRALVLAYMNALAAGDTESVIVL